MMRLLGCEFMEPKGRDELEAEAESWLNSGSSPLCIQYVLLFSFFEDQLLQLLSEHMVSIRAHGCSGSSLF